MDSHFVFSLLIVATTFVRRLVVTLRDEPIISNACDRHNTTKEFEVNGQT